MSFVTYFCPLPSLFSNVYRHGVFSKPLWNKAFLSASFKRKFVSQHRDELPIRGLILRGAHTAPESPVQRIHPSPVPRHLDGVADGAFHFAGAQGGAARLLGGLVYCISTLVFVGLFPLNSIACVYRGFGLQNDDSRKILVFSLPLRKILCFWFFPLH